MSLFLLSTSVFNVLSALVLWKCKSVTVQFCPNYYDPVFLEWPHII